MKNKTFDQKPSDCAKALPCAAKLQINSKPQDTILEKIMAFARSAPDYRRLCKGNIRHRLSDVVVLLILARMSKCVSRAEIIDFGRHNLNRLRKMGLFRNGIPSEPTLCRVEKGVDDSAFADRMRQSIERFRREALKGDRGTEIICIDGKAQCGTTLGDGRNPDIVSAYSPEYGLTLATEACQEKSNEIKAIPRLLDKIDVAGKIVTADAIAMQKGIIDKIRAGGGYFLIELKANQRALRYGVEDRLFRHAPLCAHTNGPELSHGRIETRTYRVYDGSGLIADRQKWGEGLAVVEYESETIKKSTGTHTAERRLYVTNLPANAATLGSVIRSHWLIESMHWELDVNLLQDRIKRKTMRSARNLDTIQRTVHSVFSIWKGLRKKKADKSKGMAELMRSVSMSFTDLMRFLAQKIK